MSYILKTEASKLGHEVFSKKKRGKVFVYLAKDENGNTGVVDKNWILNNRNSILNLGVSKKGNLYPINIKFYRKHWADFGSLGKCELYESESDEKRDVFVHIKCECKCQKCGKVYRFDDIIGYDEDIFEGYTYSDFKKLCKTTDFSLEKAIIENVNYICDECGADAKIVDIVDGGIYYE